MATNPLKDDPVRDARVRELAYRLWEENGRPHGRDLEFWEQARELVAIEASPGAGLLPNPQQEPNAPRETGIEEAEIQENLGEFPDRFADQGEWQATPAPVRSPRRTRPAPAASPKAPAAGKPSSRSNKKGKP